MHKLAQFIYYRLLGWKIVGEFPQLNKCVVAVVPHQDINYIAKKSLFKPPFGWYFKWMGGAPIDRSKSSDTVTAIAGIFDQKEIFRLALSPEGTRKKVEKWKTGFYYIAKAAHVPIVLVAFDYGKKQIKFSKPHVPTDDIEADFKTYKAFFKGVVGKIPEYT